MTKFHVVLIACTFFIGCAVLTTEQTYVRVDDAVKETFIP